YGLQLLFRFDDRPSHLRRHIGVLPRPAQRAARAEHTDAFRIFWRHVTRSLLRASGQRVEKSAIRVCEYWSPNCRLCTRRRTVDFPFADGDGMIGPCAMLPANAA